MKESVASKSRLGIASKVSVRKGNKLLLSLACIIIMSWNGINMFSRVCSLIPEKLLYIILGGSRAVLEATPTQEIRTDVSSAVEPQQNEQAVVEDVDEDDFLDEDVIDLRCFTPMGPIIYIELLQLPPQPKEVNGWFMQQGNTNQI